ncbi:hypothetical protein [Flexivirga lutea]
MSTTHVHARRLSVVAAVACGVVALSACSGGSSTGASSSAPTAATTSSSAAASTTSSPSASRSVLSSPSSSASGSASGKTSASSSASASKSTKPTVKADPVGACKTANSKSNAAISQWNTAVDSQSKSKLDAAARNFKSTATALRKLEGKARQKGFTSRVKAVAGDLETMASNRFAGKTVDPSTYNTDSESLRSYCQKVLTTQ